MSGLELNDDETVLFGALEKALALADEIDARGSFEAWRDVGRDVAVLVAGLRAADELMSGMVPIEMA